MSELLVFTEFHNILFSLIICLLNFTVALKAHKLYLSTNDFRMIIITAGFLTGSIFEFLHTGYSVLYSHNTSVKTYEVIVFIYLNLSNLCLSSSVLLALLYQNKNKKPFFNLNIFYFLLFLAASLSFIPLQILSSIIPEVFLNISNKLIIHNPSLEILDNALYILSAFLFFDIRRSNSYKVSSMFLIGLITLGIGQIYIVTSDYLTSIYRFYIHFSKMLGVYLVFAGLHDLLDKVNIFSLRNKLIAYPVLLLLSFYLIFTSVSQLIYNYTFPIQIQYIFLIFLLVAILIEYLLSSKLTSQLANAIQTVQKLRPQEKPEVIPVNSNDEIGMLIDNINTSAELLWKNNQELLNKQNQIIESNKREILLRNLVTNTRTLLDIKEIKRTIVKIIGESLGADRCFIIDYDQISQKFFPVESDFEYLSSPDVKSVVGIESKFEGYQYFAQLEVVKEEVFFLDLEEYLETNDLIGSFLDNYHREYDVKSNIGVPITYGDKVFGRLVLHYTKKKFHISEEDVEFIRTLVTQTGIILQQATFYDNQKRSAQRENLLRNIISTIGSTLDINDIKKYISVAIGESLKLDRCFIVEYNPVIDVLLPINKFSEYRSSENIKSIEGYDFSKKEASVFRDWGKNRLEIFIADSLEYLDKNKETINDEIRKDIKDYNVSSAFHVPLYYGNTFQGILVGHYNSLRCETSEEEKEFLRTLANQTGIALYQAKLYASEKQARKKEELLNGIVEIIRNNLDLNIMKKEIVTQIGKYLNAERGVLHQVDQETEKYLVIDEFSEYRASDDIVSYAGIDLEDPKLVFFKNLYSNRTELIAPDFPVYLEGLKDIDKETKDWILSLGIKSDYVFPIIFKNRLLASLYITYDKNYINLSKEELDGIRYLANHIGIALNQAELYHTQKQTATFEKLLREILTVCKSSLEIKEILAAICENISKALGIERVFIIDFKGLLNEEIIIADYKSQNGILSPKDISNNTENIRTYWITEIIEKDSIKIIHDADNSDMPEDIKSIYKKLQAKSIVCLPLKFGENKWGGLFLFKYFTVKHWTNDEINTLRIINEQISIALREKNLYNQEKFLTNLTHELKTPITIINGYAEALINRDTNMSELGRQFLPIIKNNVDRISGIISNLLYLSSLKKDEIMQKLEFERTELLTIINNAIEVCKEKANNKNINIIINCKDIVTANVNKLLIEQAIINLINNAINYSENNTEIFISILDNENEVSIKVTDQGCGIKQEHLNNIFERFYRVDKSRSRETGGAGLGLSIVKTIAEIHNGYVKVNSTPMKGSEFIIHIPK